MGGGTANDKTNSSNADIHEIASSQTDWYGDSRLIDKLTPSLRHILVHQCFQKFLHLPWINRLHQMSVEAGIVGIHTVAFLAVAADSY